jgi:hypothetical protein
MENGVVHYVQVATSVNWLDAVTFETFALVPHSCLSGGRGTVRSIDNAARSPVQPATLPWLRGKLSTMRNTQPPASSTQAARAFEV